MSCCIQTLTGTVCLLSGGCIMYTLSCITEAECAEFPSDHSILLCILLWCTEMFATQFIISISSLSRCFYPKCLIVGSFGIKIDLGVISILLWQLSYVCAMMWWLKCIPRSSLKALKKYISGYNISEYEVIQTLSVIVVKGLLNQPPLCLFF